MAWLPLIITLWLPGCATTRSAECSGRIKPILPDADWERRWTAEEVAQISEQCVALQKLCGTCPAAGE
jgi:hypothetical protein